LTPVPQSLVQGVLSTHIALETARGGTPDSCFGIPASE